MITRVVLILCVLAFSGCAARNVAHDPEEMAPYASEYCFVLESDVTYSEKRGLNVLWEQGLRAGIYRGALEGSMDS